jgi:capsule polysaccharide export protein KpsC/LpsZ
MNISKMSSRELQEIYTAGLALSIKKEVLSLDVEKEEVQQFIPIFPGESGFIKALNSGAEKWKPLTLVKTEKQKAKISQTDFDPTPKKAA